MILIPHHQWLMYNLRTRYKEPGMETYECVGAIKKYMKEVLGQEYRYFGGNAKTGWENRHNTFPFEIWDKIVYKPGIEPPKRGDIIFFNKPSETFHVAAVHNANKLFIVKIEQNFATGNGKGNGYDQINMNVCDFSTVVGWYSKRKLG